MSALWKCCVVAIFLILACLQAAAEQPRLPTSESIPPGLHLRPLTQNSGYIFAGTVESVQLPAPTGNSVATVQVSFHVDQGIRGVRTGQKLTIREWVGLWQSGERYRAGERVLLFLYPPSKLGLTSPVGGPMGLFRIGPDGQIVLEPGRFGVPARGSGIGDSLSRRTRVSPREFVRFVRSAEEE